MKFKIIHVCRDCGYRWNRSEHVSAKVGEPPTLESWWRDKAGEYQEQRVLAADGAEIFDFCGACRAMRAGRKHEHDAQKCFDRAQKIREAQSRKRPAAQKKKEDRS